MNEEESEYMTLKQLFKEFHVRDERAVMNVADRNSKRLAEEVNMNWDFSQWNENEKHLNSNKTRWSYSPDGEGNNPRCFLFKKSDKMKVVGILELVKNGDDDDESYLLGATNG
jgi:hypothetical protein